MSKVAIIPVFKVHTDQYEAFLKRVRQQRDDCLQHEPGCLHFDVLTHGDGETVTLYEVYSDAAALEKHRTYPHFHSFKADTGPMVRNVEVQTLSVDGGN
jgi:autoinducer 2-degrading protein